MSKYISTEIVKNGKTLVLLEASFDVFNVSEHVKGVVAEAFECLSKHIHDKTQVLYIRDIPGLNIDGKYPLGHCYNRHEAMISIPTWAVGSLDMHQLTASIYHELHHMARWQNVGYGTTLGEAILSEGIATYYEELMSGWTPPWAKVTVTKAMRRAAVREWDSDTYNHNEWFFEGKHGKWAGYAIGYELAQSLYTFKNLDLGHSVTIDADRFKDVVHGFNAI